MQQLIKALILALLLLPLVSFSESLRQQPLFKIERSKNANIVQYDIQLNPDGTPHQEEPVIAYWIRLAEQGQIKKLSWLQRVFAYGIKAKAGQKPDRIELTMAIDIGQPITAIMIDSAWHATVRVNQRLVLLEKIFVQAEGRGLRTKVEFIELTGSDAETGEGFIQRLQPCPGKSRSFCKPGTRTESDG